MGGCCSCLDAIRGGGKGGYNMSPSTEMTSSSSSGWGGDDGTSNHSNVPPPTHGMSRAMSSPNIRIRNGNMEIWGYGLALGMVPVEQDAAYWEWHVNMPGGGSSGRRSKPRGGEDGKEEDGEEEDEDDDGSFHDVGVTDDAIDDDDPCALKFGVATRKDRAFYGNLETRNDSDEHSDVDDGTALMRPISNLRHGDVIGVAVQQSDLPMIQILHNGEPLPYCTISRFRGTVYPAIYIPPGGGGDDGVGGVYTRERLEDVDGDDDDDNVGRACVGGNGRGGSKGSSGSGPTALSICAVFDEENFREMSPHARFGPLLAARGII